MDIYFVHLAYHDKPETVTETASFPGMSAQAAVYNVSTYYQKDMAKGQHIHKHFLLTWTFEFTARKHTCRKLYARAWPLLLIGADTK